MQLLSPAPPCADEPAMVQALQLQNGDGGSEAGSSSGSIAGGGSGGLLGEEVGVLPTAAAATQADAAATAALTAGGGGAVAVADADEPNTLCAAAATSAVAAPPPPPLAAALIELGPDTPTTPAVKVHSEPLSSNATIAAVGGQRGETNGAAAVYKVGGTHQSVSCWGLGAGGGAGICLGRRAVSRNGSIYT